MHRPRPQGDRRQQEAARQARPRTASTPSDWDSASVPKKAGGPSTITLTHQGRDALNARRASQYRARTTFAGWPRSMRSRSRRRSLPGPPRWRRAAASKLRTEAWQSSSQRPGSGSGAWVGASLLASIQLVMNWTSICAFASHLR
ncbi:hypothetical protein ADK59_17075 [Streptomyces sp. XY332]|nr:hypothetical protein ADK59_17075 [Streptomyces sp. XY332]